MLTPPSTATQPPAPERLWVPPASSRETRRAVLLRRFAVIGSRIDLGLAQAGRVSR